MRHVHCGKVARIGAVCDQLEVRSPATLGPIEGSNSMEKADEGSGILDHVRNDGELNRGESAMTLLSWGRANE